MISAVDGPEAPKKVAPDFKPVAAACRSAGDARKCLADASSKLADILLWAKLFFLELLSLSEKSAHQKGENFF